MFDLSKLFDTKTALRPARALLTPTWIGALLLLVANDHWLKGSGMVPGVLTGKLSDFAGMLVAPTLLAALLGVQTKRALLACHVAVGFVFAGIQLSLGFADAWAGLMALIGHPWVITSDPTDLLALPFLLLSWKLLEPEMDAELPALAPMQRTAVAGLGVFGLWSTVATSQETWVDDGDVWWQDVTGQAFVNNANDFEISLHIRPLRDDVIVDCDQVSTDPGRLLTEDAFGEAEHWTLPARTNVAFYLIGPNTCGAVWIAGEGIAPIIVFSDDTSRLPERWFEGQSLDTSGLGSTGMAITFPAEGPSEWSGADDLRFVPKTRTPEQPASCEPPADEMRFAWPLTVPSQPVQLLAVEAGVDGCFELEVQELVDGGAEPQPLGQPYSFYLCAPAAAMPFVADDVVRFTDGYGSGSARELSIALLDAATLTPAIDEQGRLLRQARYLSGGSDPLWIGPAINRTLVAVDSVNCPWDIEEDDGCADVQRLVNLAVDGGSNYLQPGAPVSFADPGPNGMVRTAVLGHARQLAVIDQACAQGSLQLRYDIDIAVIEEPLL